MYLPLIFTIIVIGLSAALVAWYYNRASQTVRFEYLGSSRSGMSGRADDTYRALVRPLRIRRMIALCVSALATCVAVALVGLRHS